MRSVILFFILAVLTIVSGLPRLDEFKQKGLLTQVEGDLESLDKISLPETSSEETGLRFRRVTCDLLSVNIPFGSLNHSACAAHCLAKRKGFRGGRCKDGVCHCRK